ncbi:MAG: RICIN domain-containing protein, partial [Agathobacter sp.]|nr:RICIN domain-containing protein [Agathobacter sp.]
MKTFKKVVRVIAYVLLLCFMVTELSGVAEVIAAERKINNSVQQESTVENKGNKKDKEKFEDDDVIFKHLDKENFKNGKHISRLEHEEKLNTYVFGNEDGSKTVYYMYENVKYKDKDGKIKDKDISLVKKDKGYGIVQNEVDLFLPENPSDGVTVNYSGYDVTIIPQGGNGKVKAKQCDDAIIYDEYFGKNASLKYTPLLSGVKEDIILNSYVENATYDFIVETNGLYIYNDDIGYYLADETNSTIIYYLGDVEVYDAIGKPELGEMKVTVLEEGQRYRLTLSVSDAFLSDPETVYPVTIDPTITISDNTTGANSIIDAPIFEAKKNTNYAKYKYNTVGTTTASYGVGRTVVKLQGLIDSIEYQSLYHHQIISVKFYVRDSSGTGKQFIHLYPLENINWTETGVTWTNVGNYCKDCDYGATLSSGKVTAFDITELVCQWKWEEHYEDAGFILINSTETKNKSFCSSEYGTTSYRPYVELTYTSELWLDEESLNIAEGGTGSVIAITNPDGKKVTWEIKDKSIATISSTDNTTCVVKGVRAGKTELVATLADDSGETGPVTCDIFVYIPDGVYYIQNMNSGHCLEVPNGSILNYTKIEQAAQYSSTTNEVTRLRQMWKVKYIEEGCYSIRPLHNTEMGLYWGSNLMVWNIGTDDNVYSIPQNAQWTIKWGNTGYLIKQYGDDKTAAVQVSGASKTTGANIVTGMDVANANCRWTFTKVSNVPSGIVLYDTSTGQALSGGATRAVAVDEIRTLEDLKLKAVVYTGDFKNYGITWSLPNLSYCNYMDIDSSTGTVIGLEEKSVTITATSVLYNGPKSTSYTLKIIPVRTGTYYIKNRQFSKYLQIDNNDAANDYKSLGVIMEQWTYDGEDYQKWKLVSLENGYYKIISVQSGLALSVPSGKTSAQDVELIQEIYTGDSRQQWKITQTQYGSYKIKPRSSEGLTNDLVMAVGDSITVGWDGTNIQQRVYVNNTSYMDEWYIRNPYYATVNIYYDMGYCVQFDETKEEAESSIRKYMRKVAGIFEEEFGLHIDYTITFYNSPIDQCKGEVTKDNINRLCTHGADHTNKENMKNSFKASYPGSDTVITLYWTGHALSLESGKGNGNVSCSSDYSLFLLGNKVPEEDRERRSYRGLLHELCHQFSVKDHYHTEENDTKDADGKVVIGKCKNEKYGCSTCADDRRDRNCVIGEETADN